MAITSALEESAKVTEEAWEDMACPGALGPAAQGGQKQSQETSFTQVLSRFSRVRLFATLWTVARQAPPSMGIL